MIAYWFDAATKHYAKQDTQSKQKSEEGIQESYCCAVCQQFITSDASAIHVEGGHIHIKINPQGKKFLLRCFASTSGTELSGDPTSHFSWFSGFNWQFVHCGQCGAQLGWFYGGQGNSFYGLIKEQLVCCDG